MPIEPEILKTLTTAPTVQAVTLAEAKHQCRIESTDTDEDDWLNRAIKSSTLIVEAKAGKALLEQSWTIKRCPLFGVEPLHLPIIPVISITSINYYDGDNVSQSLGVIYDLLNDEDHARLELQEGQSWPAMFARDDAVAIEYKAGFGVVESAVPEILRDAVLMMIAHKFQHRGDSGENDVPKAVDDQINLLRVGWFG